MKHKDDSDKVKRCRCDGDTFSLDGGKTYRCKRCRKKTRGRAASYPPEPSRSGVCMVGEVYEANTLLWESDTTGLDYYDTAICPFYHYKK